MAAARRRLQEQRERTISVRQIVALGGRARRWEKKWIKEGHLTLLKWVPVEERKRPGLLPEQLALDASLQHSLLSNESRRRSVRQRNKRAMSSANLGSHLSDNKAPSSAPPRVHTSLRRAMTSANISSIPFSLNRKRDRNEQDEQQDVEVDDSGGDKRQRIE
jgi:hypothetical protein